MIAGLIKYHLLVLLREPLNLFFGFGLPFLQLFVMSGSLRGEGSGEMMNGALPVFVIIAAMVLCFTDSALSHAYARQIKFLRRLRMTPIKPIHYIFTGIISRIGVLILFAASFIAVTAVFFDMSVEGRNWALFIAVLLLSFIMFYLIGMFFANLLKGAKNSQGIIYVVFFGLLLLGGIMLPVEAMPDVLQTISNALPPTYAINVLGFAWNGTNLFYSYYFIAMVVTTVVFGLLSLKFFKFE